MSSATLKNLFAQVARLVSVVGLASSCSTAQVGDVIDFETVAGRAPVDNEPISTHYESSHGVRFGLDVDLDGIADANQFPIVEAVGQDEDGSDGFLNDTLREWDTEHADAEGGLGRFFLRTPSFETPFNLIVAYSSPVAAASGEIWDVDGRAGNSEQWLIQAIDANNAVLDERLSPDAANLALDGRPWKFSFGPRQAEDIHGLRILFKGSKTSGIGLAFDNFSPADSDAIPTDCGDVEEELEALKECVQQCINSSR